MKPLTLVRNMLGDGSKTPEPQPRTEAPQPQSQPQDAPQPASLKPRHRRIVASFVLGVLAPLVVVAAYLLFIARDQYVSTLGFAVRSEELSAAQSLLGGLASISGSSTSDTDILYEFIQSEHLVAAVDRDLDLRAMWSRPAFDPVFAYGGDGTIETLADYWKRMVKVSYTSGTGLIEVQVRAFTPEDALAIAQDIEKKSTAMINDLSAIAREDEIRYAREDMDAAVARLRDNRETLTAFRSQMQIVDPQADVQGQMGLLNSLQVQLADALISQQTLPQTRGSDNDPRAEALRHENGGEKVDHGSGGMSPLRAA